MLTWLCLVEAALLGWAASAPTSGSAFALFETHRAPPTFTRLSTPPPQTHSLKLRIGLKQPHGHLLDQHALAVSDPGHPRYGRFLDDAQLAELTAPDGESVDAVADWLASHGLVGEWSSNREWVVVSEVPLPKVERMLDAKYALFQHASGDVLVRTEAWSLPWPLHRHVDLIQPTTMFGRLHADRSDIGAIIDDQSPLSPLLGPLIGILGGGPAPGAPPACTNPANVTVQCRRQLYHTDTYVPKVPQQNAIGITGYIGNYAQYSDFALYMADQRPDQAGFKFQVQLPPGGVNPQGFNETQLDNFNNLESNLDTQTAAGATAPTTNIFYSTPGSPPFTPDAANPTNTNEPYLDWLSYIQSLPTSAVPKTISTSYGDDEQTVPLSYATRVCNGFRDLGARGVSLLFSSGDAGVGPDGACVSNDGKNTTRFVPKFPSTCPWVTSTGATEQFSPEVAANASGAAGFTSGGGFSNYFSAPLYQTVDTLAYTVGLLGKYNGLYHQGGRGYPDVAAQGSRYRTAYNGRFYRVSGTSAATPTFASIIALLNDYRLSRGQGPLGFLNPWLYSVGRLGLNDITVGSSSGCGTDGFPARPGWDAVTGLGTPDFTKLQQFV